MLCYYFPPLIACGANRSAGFVEHLPEFGWDSLVLSVEASKDPWVKTGGQEAKHSNVCRTSEWNLAGIADSLNGVLAKSLSLFRYDLKTNYFRDLLIPDQQIAWFSTRAGTRLAKSCDLIYASCSPFSSALSAVRIARKRGLPLVLDFRDPWTLNNYIHHTPIHRNAIEAMEERVISDCDRLILNTPGTLRLYREKYPTFAEKMCAIPNGYDQLTPVKPKADTDIFRIMHIGSFYGTRSPRTLLQALSELEIPAEFVQVGGDFPEREEFAGRVKITVYPVVPRERALELMGEASLLYLKQGWEKGVKDYVAVAAKTYEYLTTGLPILAEVPPGDNAEIIQRYGANSSVLLSEDPKEMRNAIIQAYEQRTAKVVGINEEFARDFNRRNLTQRLAEVFDDLGSRKTVFHQMSK